MQSFHRSSGKILFELFCAFAVSASCVGAWMQTGAWSLLVAASVAALYGFSHAFDLARRRPAVASADTELATGNPDGVLSDGDADVPLTATDGQSMTEARIENADPVDPAEGAPPAKVRRTKTRRKSGVRRTNGGKQTKAVEAVPLAEDDISASPAAGEAHFPLVPLFEPQPFMRQQRPVFGRKDNPA
jgi:hypothetical protein